MKLTDLNLSSVVFVKGIFSLLQWCDQLPEVSSSWGHIRGDSWLLIVLKGNIKSCVIQCASHAFIENSEHCSHNFFFFLSLHIALIFVWFQNMTDWGKEKLKRFETPFLIHYISYSATNCLMLHLTCSPASHFVI